MFGYCREEVFHRGARNSLGNSARPGTTNSGEGGCIGRKFVVVDEVEGSCAVVNLVSSVAIVGRQKISHVLIRILVRSMDVCSAGH